MVETVTIVINQATPSTCVVVFLENSDMASGFCESSCTCNAPGTGAFGFIQSAFLYSNRCMRGGLTNDHDALWFTHTSKVVNKNSEAGGRAQLRDNRMGATW